jgi:hypothetical protein
MIIDVDPSEVTEALLDQVRELSGRLARASAAIKAQQQSIEGLGQENRQQLDTIMELHRQIEALRQPAQPG